MKKNWIIIAVVVLIGLKGLSSFNGLITKEEATKQTWAEVETQYQRRSDLIPNLVNTVKGYAEFEQETLTGVIEARAKATSVSIDPSNLSPAAIAQFEQAQQGVNSALSKLLVTVERYPDLKANQQFSQLQVQLEGTENRIAVARRNFNTSIGTWNKGIQRLPGLVIAMLRGYEQKGYFKAAVGTETAPAVSFD